MKHAFSIESIWHDLVCFTKEYWVQVAVFCIFAAFVYLVTIFLFNL